MKLTNNMLLLAILAASLAACGKKDEPAVPAPTATPAATAPVTTAPAEPTMAPAAAEPAMTAPPVASDGAMAASGELPAACEAYLKRAAACYEKVAASNPAAVDQMRSSLDQTRAQWLSVPDKSQLGTACTMADTQFAQSVAMLKCE